MRGDIHSAPLFLVYSGKDANTYGEGVEKIQEAHTDDWMAIDSVECTAIGLFEGKPCIKIFSSKKAEDLQAKIPTNIEGFPVIIEETGTFRALD